MKICRSIFILTGAGISAESGLRTFRDNDGLWENHKIEDVATPEAFLKDPNFVHRFYNERRRQLRAPEITPNDGHKAIVDLEANFQGELILVTQNVDDLHERAGSRNVIHMHGELKKVRCWGSGQVFAMADDISAESICSCCNQIGSLRPHIVWFGESPLHMHEITLALNRCDLFLAIGTSGVVYPAAQFVKQARNAYKIEINPQKSERSNLFNQQVPYPASIGVPHVVSQILKSNGTK